MLDEPSPAAVYRRVATIMCDLGDLTVVAHTRAGFAAWWQADPAMQLLARLVELAPGTETLVMPCGHGALGVWAARHAGADAVRLGDPNVIAAEMAGRTLAANGLDPARARVGLPAGPCDAVLLAAPRGRHLCRLLLWHAWETLRPGGQLYLGGMNDLGIKSVIADAETLFGAAQVLGYKGGGRAVRLVRAAQAPDPLPAAFLEAGIAPGSYHQFEVSVGAQHYTLQTRPGVFAWQGLDDGTAMLLDHLTVGAEERVVDVGCGHGLIGIHAARLAERGAVHLVDVDALAVECARRNAQVNLGRDLPVTLGDGLPALGVQNLTLIVSNPPFHAGRDVSLGMVHAIIEDAHERLERSGRLVLVANRFLRYQAPMHARFGNVEELAQSPQYHVLAAEKRHAKAPQSPRPPRGAHMVNRTRG